MAPKINEKWFLKSCRRPFHLNSILAQKIRSFKKKYQLDEFISAHLCKSSDVKYFVKLIILSACPKKKYFASLLVGGGAAPLLLAPLVMGSTRPKPKFLLNHIWYTTNIKKESWLRFSIFFFFSEKVRAMPRELKKSKVPKEKTTSSLRALNKTGGWRGLLTYKAWLRNFSSKPWNCQEFNWKR